MSMSTVTVAVAVYDAAELDGVRHVEVSPELFAELDRFRSEGMCGPALLEELRRFLPHAAPALADRSPGELPLELRDHLCGRYLLARDGTPPPLPTFYCQIR